MKTINTYFSTPICGKNEQGSILHGRDWASLYVQKYLGIS